MIERRAVSKPAMCLAFFPQSNEKWGFMFALVLPLAPLFDQLICELLWTIIDFIIAVCSTLSRCFVRFILVITRLWGNMLIHSST